MTLSTDGETLNPYKPIRVKLNTAPTVTSGNWAVRLKYRGLTTGSLITTARTTTSIEALAVTGAANSMHSMTTSTAVIPNTEFAGFVNGAWVINKDRLVVALERVGSDVADTNAGVMNLFEVELFQ